MSNSFPVTAGKTYVLSASAAMYETTGASNLYFRILAGSTDALIEYPGTTQANSVPFGGEDPNWGESIALAAGAGRAPTPAEFQPFSGEFTAPAGVSYASVEILVITPTSQVTVYVDDVAVVEKGVGASELTSAGLRLFGVEGTEVGAFVSNRPNYFSVTDPTDGHSIASISQDGEISGQDLTITNDPIIQGIPLVGRYGNSLPDSVDFLNDPVNYGRDYNTDPVGIIEQYGKGNVAWAQFQDSDFPTRSLTAGQETALFELGYDLEPGRQYEFRTSNFLVETTGAGTLGMVIRATTDGSSPSLSSGVFARDFKRIASSGQVSVGITGRPLNGGVITQTQLRVLVGLTYGSSATGTMTISQVGQALFAMIDDKGPIKTLTGTIRNYKTGGSTGGGSTVARTYTKTYTATGYSTYRGSGTKRTDTTDIVQGYNSANGNGKGIWIFPSMTADLAGATIKKVEVYAYANHWYNNSGGKARIYLHGYSASPASSPTVSYSMERAGWPKPGGLWTTLPSSVYGNIQNGTWKGFGMGPAPSTSPVYYGRFNGPGAKIRVTYTK